MARLQTVRRKTSDAATRSRESFFTRQSRTAIQRKKEASFFQAKLTVGEPNDAYEQEADSVASQVVNQSQAGPALQKKKIAGIQRLATSKADETTGTDEERMRRDKEIQRMPDTRGKEKPKEDEEKMGGGSAVQMKQEGGGAVASTQVSSRIEQKAGKGHSMAAGTKEQMQSSIGADFEGVNIHTDAESIALNRELGAQAFTHGRDIYFNAGKYDPESTQGKKLLAHELTHVVQQTGTGTETKAD
jgi:hypothetical protein